MKIELKKDPLVPENELHIHCRKITAEVQTVLNKLQVHKISGKSPENETMVIPLLSVLYFESVDKRVFAYTENQVLETGYRLYELEEKFPAGWFFRISKTMIVNMGKIRSIRPEEGRRLKVQLQNGEWLLVSRAYAASFQRQLKEEIS